MTKLTPAAKRQFAQVTNLEDDGDFLEVRFVRSNGERVIGIYKRFGWSQPPAKEAAEFEKIFTAAPRSIRRQR